VKSGINFKKTTTIMNEGNGIIVYE